MTGDQLLTQIIIRKNLALAEIKSRFQLQRLSEKILATEKTLTTERIFLIMS